MDRRAQRPLANPGSASTTQGTLGQLQSPISNIRQSCLRSFQLSRGQLTSLDLPIVSSHTQETAEPWVGSRDVAFNGCVTPSTVLALSEPLCNEHHNGSRLGALNGKHPAPAWHTVGTQQTVATIMTVINTHTSPICTHTASLMQLSHKLSAIIHSPGSPPSSLEAQRRQCTESNLRPWPWPTPTTCSRSVAACA